MGVNSNILKTFQDPVIWCESYLKNPMNRDEPLKFRSYQKDVLRNSRKYQRMITRWGRRTGKSVAFDADCLWWAQAYPLVRMIENKEDKIKPFRILVFCPYESQIKELWNTFTQLIGDSPLLKDQVLKIRTSDIHLIEFKGPDNETRGSTIEGFTIGISSSNQGTSLRGLTGDMVLSGNSIRTSINNIIRSMIEKITPAHTQLFEIFWTGK